MFIKLIMAILCLQSFSGISMHANEPVPYDKIASKIIKSASDRLSKKHHMEIIGVKQSMMGCVKLIGFRFQVYRKLSKDEARAIVIDCAQSFLAEINQNEAIRKDLQVYPFDSEHIEVVLFIDRPDRGTFYHPDLAVVATRRGQVTYTTNDPDHKYKYKSEETESFEEAVKILQNQASSNQTP